MSLFISSSWEIAALAAPSFEESKRLTITCLIVATVSFCIALIAASIMDGVFPEYRICSLALASAPMVVALPLAGRLFRCSDSKMVYLISCCCIVGVACVVPAQLAMHDSLNTVSSSFVAAGLLEEFLKIFCYLSPVWAGMVRDCYKLVFASLVAGYYFGVVENLVYGLTIEYTERAAYMTIVRHLSFPLTHACFSMIGGIFFAYSKIGLVPSWVAIPLMGIVPVALHGAYDTTLFTYQECSRSLEDGCENWLQGALVVLLVSLVTPFVMMLPLRKRRVEPAAVCV